MEDISKNIGEQMTIEDGLKDMEELLTMIKQTEIFFFVVLMVLWVKSRTLKKFQLMMVVLVMNLFQLIVIRQIRLSKQAHEA